MHFFKILPVILLANLQVLFVTTLTQKSISVFKRVSGSSPQSAIGCAFRQWKAGAKGAKIAENTDSCENLIFEKWLNTSNLEPGFEYIRTTTLYETKVLTESTKYTESVVHFLAREVKVGDKFQFMMHKEMNTTNKDSFLINFRNSDYSVNVLKFIAQSSQLALNDKKDDIHGTPENPAYPFADCKEYRLMFEVLESHWQIYITTLSSQPFLTDSLSLRSNGSL